MTGEFDERPRWQALRGNAVLGTYDSAGQAIWAADLDALREGMALEWNVAPADTWKGAPRPPAGGAAYTVKRVEDALRPLAHGRQPE